MPFDVSKSKKLFLIFYFKGRPPIKSVFFQALSFLKKTWLFIQKNIHFFKKCRIVDPQIQVNRSCSRNQSQCCKSQQTKQSCSTFEPINCLKRKWKNTDDKPIVSKFPNSQPPPSSCISTFFIFNEIPLKNVSHLSSRLLRVGKLGYWCPKIVFL